MSVFSQDRAWIKVLPWVIFAVASFSLLRTSVGGVTVHPGMAGFAGFCSCFFILALLLARFAYSSAVVITLFVLIAVNLFISALATPGQMVFSLLLLLPFTIVVLIMVNVFLARHRSFVSAKSAKISEHRESKNLLELEFRKNVAIKESYIKKMDRYWKFRMTAEAAASILSIAELREKIIQSTKDIIGKGDAYFLYMPGDDGEIGLRNFEIVSDGIVVDDYAEPDEFISWVMHNRQPLCVSDTENDFRFGPASERKTPARSLIIHPLTGDDEALGFLRIDSLQREHLNLDDLRVLSIISHLFSMLLQTVRLFLQTIELAIKDSLTGLFVRRYFDEEFESMTEKSREDGTVFSLMLMDMDLLKKVNDEFGHMVGDILLQNAARAIKSICPEGAVVARFGGEEFSCLLKDCTKQQAAEVAERVRQAIDELAINIRRQKIHTTISIGIAQFPQDAENGSQLIKQADMALYKAKQEGRNRVVLC